MTIVEGLSYIFISWVGYSSASSPSSASLVFKLFIGQARVRSGSFAHPFHYPAQVGAEKTRVRFFMEQPPTGPLSIPKGPRVKNIVRHRLNNRVQNGVRECYKQSVKLRGIVEGVRGEAWVCEPGIDPKSGEKAGPYEALSFASFAG